MNKITSRVCWYVNCVCANVVTCYLTKVTCTRCRIRLGLQPLVVVGVPGPATKLVEAALAFSEQDNDSTVVVDDPCVPPALDTFEDDPTRTDIVVKRHDHTVTFGAFAVTRNPAGVA